jgi:hypothetical protein
MSVTQDQVDRLFCSQTIEASMEHELDMEIPDAKKIKEVVERQFGIQISVVEAKHFWQWHSTDFDAGWLGVGEYDDAVIIKYFERFLVEHGISP